MVQKIPAAMMDPDDAPVSFAGVSTQPSLVAFSATAMAVNCSLSNIFETTLTANVTVAPTFTNVFDGKVINWFLTQDGTGSRTMTWPSGSLIKWEGGTPPVLSTAAGSVDCLVAIYRSSTGLWYGALRKNFG